MKTIFFNLLTAIFSLFILSALVSCSSDDNSITETVPQNNLTIAQIANSNENLSLLVQALNRTNLTDVLNNEGNFTVFAPTNEFFTSFLSNNGFTSLNDVPVPVLREVLLNHVVNNKLESSNFITGYINTLAKGNASNTSNISMYINTSNGVEINGGKANNGAKVTQANIQASNGVIHLVDNVISLPTIVNHAIANPNFSILVSALTRNDQPDFVSILSGSEASPFTVFAPTNSAFQNLLQELELNDLSQIPTSVLENTLKYHVVAGSNVLSSQITNGLIVESFQGDTFTINLDNEVTITDTEGRVSKIIIVDVQADNGVIHAIDKVILPNF